MDSNDENENKLERSRDNDPDIDIKIISPESCIKYEIFELKEIPPFENNMLDKLNNAPLYFKRFLVDEFLKSHNSENPYLEILLKNDDTYEELQKLYLDNLVKKINEKNIDKILKLNIIEKIIIFTY